MAESIKERGVGHDRQRRPWFRGRYVVVALPLALVASCGGISVVSRAFNACDVGINGSANALGLLFQLPVLVLVQGAALVGGYVLAGRWAGSGFARAGLAVLFTVVVLVALSWMYFAVAGLPLQNALCPAGEPPWWPRWLPPSRSDYP